MKRTNLPSVTWFLLQNTYTNAEKLLAAAEELAQTGECNAEDIYRYSWAFLQVQLSISAGTVEGINRYEVLLTILTGSVRISMGRAEDIYGYSLGYLKV
jgi:hypothetical protein